MKKIITFISVLTIYSTSIFAQATPNASFENWTHNAFPSYDTPDNWDNLNPSTGALGVYTCIKETTAANVHSGVAAVKLITKSVFGITANGIATTGTINTTAQTITGGIPYTLRPDSITGWYKYVSVSGDNGFAEILLLGAGGVSDTIGHARFMTSTNNVFTWTRFSMPITYFNTNAVVTSLWILSSSKDAVIHSVGSTAFFDDLELVFVTTSVAEQAGSPINVFPNPAADYLMIKNNFTPHSKFVLCDVAGRTVLEKQLGDEKFIDVRSLTGGIYIYSVLDGKNRIVKTGKVIIRR